MERMQTIGAWWLSEAKEATESPVAPKPEIDIMIEDVGE